MKTGRILDATSPGVGSATPPVNPNSMRSSVTSRFSTADTRAWNPVRRRNRQHGLCIQPGVTEDEITRIAELHLDGDPVVLAQLRRDPATSAVLAALDLVVWEFELLRNTRPDTG